MQIIYKRTADLKPYEKNPRINDQAVAAVAQSIEEFGFKNPVIIDANDEIICGHTRWKAAQRLGIEAVPCIKADDLTDEQVRAFRLADNKVAELAEWDLELLGEELANICSIDMAAFGFEEFELDTKAEVEEVDVPEEVEPRTQPGEIWKLGQHFLICGDSTDADTIKRLTQGETMDLWVTDPPYNIAYEGKTKDKLTIENDSWANEDEFIEFLCKAYEAALQVLKPGGAFYIWHADTQALNFRIACEKTGMQIRQNLVWVKSIFALGRQDYQWRHEPCLYGWKDGAAHYFTDNRTLSTVFEEPVDFESMKKEEMRELLRKIYEETKTTTIHVDKPSRSAEHPTMKPITLISQQIENSSRRGQRVIDTFGGSGTTLMCCEQLGRICYTAELDPHYCDVIIQRWEDYTKSKAVRVNG